ncbi:hypothetical protein AMS68_002209 [Peltaster fructicola]|uniref:Uncharacterized protein n=1 Tax=Peltaster fructicola TaxID=286661 RepID=A0A6H0XPK1_9PEZI|nr:hypothetical protein AMS68_002209 [Peltaster fructicola]
MSTNLLFVTAKLSVKRVNDFLTKAPEVERAILPDSIFFLVEDSHVPYEKIFNETSTEPPVSDFQSGFIGASDDDLWKQLESYSDAERKQDHAGTLHEEIIVVLDKESEKDDTVSMLYRKQDGEKTKWRAPFRFAVPIIMQMPFDDEEPWLNGVDDDGAIRMTEVYKALDVDWTHGDS